MLAGEDSIDDMAILRRGGTASFLVTFGSWTPSSYRVLAGPAAATPLLAGVLMVMSWLM
jgi:hypothetical protein